MRYIMLLLMAASSRADTFTVAVDGVDGAAQPWKTLAYACEQVPAGEHVIQLEAGTFPCPATAKPKNGVTIAGRGEKTKLVPVSGWKLGNATAIPKPAGEFLIACDKPKNVVIRDLAMACDPKDRISGAVFLSRGEGVTLKNLTLDEFGWAAIYVEHCSGINIDHCNINNGSMVKDKYHSGAIRARWLKNSEIQYCRVIQTGGQEYGYKAGGHEKVRIHHCVFEQTGEFSLESAHESEYGLEIDHNIINRCISVPKSNPGDDPNKRKFEYSVRIHHNWLTDSYTVEGPRNHLKIDHNYINIQNTGGRCYSVHGGTNAGPVWITHNVVDNLDRAFVWKNRDNCDGVHVLNNTVFTADAEKRAGPFIDVYKPENTKGWEVKNNIFVAVASQPRKLSTDASGKLLGVSENLCVNVTGSEKGEAGLALAGEKPWPFYRPLKASPYGAIGFEEKAFLDDLPKK